MKKRIIILAILALLLLVVSCDNGAPTAVPDAPTHTLPPPTSTAAPPTDTPLPLTDTVEPPTDPAPPTDIPDAPTAAPAQPPLLNGSGGGILAFLSDREARVVELYTMNADGTAPRRLAPAADGFIVGPSWSPDGQRIAYAKIIPDENGRLDNHGTFEVWVTSLDGNQMEKLSGEITDQLLALPYPTPAWSPDGTRLAFIAAHESDEGDLLSSVYVLAASGGKLEWSLPLPWLALEVLWSPAGDELLLVSFDEETGTSSIHTLSIEKGELVEIYQGAQAAGWSPDGSKIVISAYQPPNILVVGAEGNEQTLAHLEGRYPLAVKWSPDGSHIVVGSSHSSSLMKITALHLISLETQEITPVISHPAGKYIYAPNWSPSGDRLLYTTTDNHRIRQGDTLFADLWIYDLISGEILQLTSGEFHDGMGVWTPSTALQTSASVIQAPQGSAATIDGTFSPGEWDGALSTDLVNGGELMLMHADGYLYLGIRSRAMGFGSICTADGNQVSILHASAGLGTAIFERDGDDWQRTQQFSYCCWEAPQSRLDEFLREEGWVASIGPKGIPEEMEYQIAMKDGSLTLAVVYIDDFSFETALHWPAHLADDCLGLALIPEDPPERLLFAPETWVTIVAETEEE